MKRWSISDLPADFYIKLTTLQKLTRKEIQSLWIEKGQKDITAFGLTWWRAESLTGINNYRPFIENETPFSISVDNWFLEQYNAVELAAHYEHIAVLLAIELGMQEYRLVPV